MRFGPSFCHRILLEVWLDRISSLEALLRGILVCDSPRRCLIVLKLYASMSSYDYLFSIIHNQPLSFPSPPCSLQGTHKMLLNSLSNSEIVFPHFPLSDLTLTPQHKLGSNRFFHKYSLKCSFCSVLEHHVLRSEQSHVHGTDWKTSSAKPPYLSDKKNLWDQNRPFE